MIVLTPEIVNDQTFRPYGMLYDLSVDGTADNVIRSAGFGYTDGYTVKPLIDRPGNLGMTYASAVPFPISRMERHLHTQEAIICAGEPIAFLAAPAALESPAAKDVQAFLLTPGQVVVLHRGTWHSPALGIYGPATYYWMAEAYDTDPTIWKTIEMGPVHLAGPSMRE